MTLLLNASDVRRLLPIADCIHAVERAFRLYGEGTAPAPGVLGIHARSGGFHLKAGLLELGREYFAVKANGNFPENPRRSGLPTIQGLVVLCDAHDGRPLAVMDSIALTQLRTAAATAVAARHLMRDEPAVLTLCGCGAQSGDQLAALAAVRRLRRVFVHDIDMDRAQAFIRSWSSHYDFEIQVEPDLSEALRRSQAVITCTTATRFFVEAGMVAPGTFIAAVGADSEAKQELDPALLARSIVVCDLVEQCAAIGELHHALQAGVIQRSAAHELSAVVAGKLRLPIGPDDTVIFDSTGTALQDIAAAAMVYERAAAAPEVRTFDFAGAGAEATA